MLRQIVTLSLKRTVKEDDFTRYVVDKMWPIFDPRKCDFSAWCTDPEVIVAGPRYRFEVTYFDQPEYEELGAKWEDVWRQKDLTDYIGSYFSLETYWNMQPGSAFKVAGWTGTRTQCTVNKCPRNVNTGSARKCTNNQQHVFCDHRLVHCPNCPPGTRYPVK